MYRTNDLSRYFATSLVDWVQTWKSPSEGSSPDIYQRIEAEQLNNDNYRGLPFTSIKVYEELWTWLYCKCTEIASSLRKAQRFLRSIDDEDHFQLKEISFVNRNDF
jgi:hypothetical protein